MRTKTLLLTAALGIAGMASTMAQVYSVNAVGYVNKPLVAGFTMVANPLNTTNNSIEFVLTGLPAGATAYRWTGTTYAVSTYFGIPGFLWDSTFNLNPGEGCFINMPSVGNMTFVGEVMQGNLTNPSPAGFSIRSSMVPQAGAVDTLGLTNLTAGDTLYRWNTTTQGFVVHTYFGIPGFLWDIVPSVEVGEAFFLNLQQPKNWVRSFSVNN